SCDAHNTDRVIRDIEECDTWESVIESIEKGLEPFKAQFYREIVRDDIIRLTEIRIKRISRYDTFKADKEVRSLQERLDKVNRYLEDLIGYTIDYFRSVKKKFGKGRERKTEIRFFDSIDASRVAVANAKLYVNREEGFAGTSLKKDEFVCECSDLDDIIVFREDGTYIVTRVAEKSFVGKNVIHIGVFERNDERTIYNVIYRDGQAGATYMKRFPVKGVTRDKEYDLTRGTKGSKVLYFTANPNGEAEVVTVYLRHKPRLKKNVFDLNFSELAIKGRGAAGNILTKHAVRRIAMKDAGVSTLGAMDIWFDETVLRLNSEKRGTYLGAFKGDEKILAIYSEGQYRVMNFDLSNHFEENPLILQKLYPGTIVSAVYFDQEKGHYYIKRFEPEANGKFTDFLNTPGSRLVLVTTEKHPRLLVTFPASERRQKTDEEIDVADFIAVKSQRARGKRLSSTEVKTVQWLEPQPAEGKPDDDSGSEPEPGAMKGEQQKGSLDEVNNAGQKDVENEREGGTPDDKEKQIRLDLDL
ncbi:MAG: DNA gyrase/topoisomerase IV subunit A, partial [Bacteroidales bacterium]